MKRLIKWFVALTVFVAVLGTSPVFAEVKVPERPSNSAVYDPKGYIDDHTEEEINKLNQDREEQVAVVVLETLDSMSIEEFSNKTARAWQIGYSDTNAGALVVISVRDRKSRIETSNNFAVYVPDSDTRWMLEDAKQLLRSEDYSGALFDIAQGLHTSYQKSKQSESAVGKGDSPKVDSISVMLSMLSVLTVIGAVVAMTVFIYKKVNRGRIDIESERRGEFFEDRRAMSTSGLQNRQTRGEINDLINSSTAAILVASHLNTKKRSTSSSYSSSRKKDDDYMSPSSWSPSDWGGGGFDGGGSSSDW